MIHCHSPLPHHPYPYPTDFSSPISQNTLSPTIQEHPPEGRGLVGAGGELEDC